MRLLFTILLCLLFQTKHFGQTEVTQLKISRLTDNFYVYTTYNLYQGNRIPANGLYIVTQRGVIMIDSPWDTTQFQPLLDSIRFKHNKKVVLNLATHFHEDRTGGLNYYRRQGIATYTTRKTDSLSKATGKNRAEFLFDKDTVFTVGQYSFQTYYPGHGHTADNIVIWFEKEKILYGGCLIKSVNDDTLGNLADASVSDYAATLGKVQKKFKKPSVVIPGHNAWNSTESLNHSLKMALELNRKG